LKVLVIGGGGREHAIAWSLAAEGATVFASPGNPGIARVATCLAAHSNTPDGWRALADHLRPDLTVVGPEAPLVAGVTDALTAAGYPVFGPTAQAAQLEASKLFAKQVLVDAGIPTAAYAATTSPAAARDALKSFSYPVVLKADGLAAGKGVIIAETPAEAEAALTTLTSTLGPNILIEEFLRGEEASFIVLCDGLDALPLEASQDHKRIFDDDQGPNTGGMGSYTDGRILTAAQQSDVMERIIAPTLHALHKRGCPFRGFLYAGLMLTDDGPKVLEFNVRLGDPEAQSLLHRLNGGFLDTLRAATTGTLPSARLSWRPDPSVCIVLASRGYPDTPVTGDAIHGIEEAERTGATVFHSGTRLNNNALATAGGRVLGVTASGPTLPAAIANAYTAAACIHFDGMQYRMDIGRKGLKRW
jgi:phosphoribosylamine--glycine ligase